jgi:hypothetical protein
MEIFAFYSNYLCGKVFEVAGETFLASIPESQVFTINDDDDTLKVFEGTYPDLSLKLYKIDMIDSEFKEKGNLEFSITGGSADLSDVDYLVFGYSQGTITRIPEEGKLDSEDIQGYESLVVMIFNGTANKPYTGNSTIEFTIKAKKKKDLPFTRCQVELSIMGTRLVERIPPEVDPYESSSSVFNTWKTVGSCDKNVFTGTLDPQYHPETRTGTLSVEFDEDLNIMGFSLKAYDRNHVHDTVSWEIEGLSLNKSFEYGNSVTHEVLGTNACGSLISVDSYSESTHASGGMGTYRLIDHSCNEFSLLKLQFSAY